MTLEGKYENSNFPTTPDYNLTVQGTYVKYRTPSHGLHKTLETYLVHVGPTFDTQT